MPTPISVAAADPATAEQLVRQFNRPTQLVVCAALRHPTNGRIICGARHYDPIMRAQINATEGPAAWKGCDQGFIDQYLPDRRAAGSD